MEKTEIEVPDEEQAEAPVREWLDPEKNQSAVRQYQKFKVIRPFFLKTKNGPAVVVQPGEVVELADPHFISDIFTCDRIEPLDKIIPAVAEYSAVKQFQCVINGEYKQVRLLDILELTGDEARPLLKTRSIKPMDDKHFSLA